MVNTISGKDTLILDDRVLTDIADGDSSTLTYANDLVTVKTGKNQNTLYAKNETGNNVQLVLRVMRGSSDDKYLQKRQAELDGDISAFELIRGEFIKRLGDGQGNVMRDVYSLDGGIFVKKVEAKENVEGDTEQAVSIYNLTFARAIRSVQ